MVLVINYMNWPFACRFIDFELQIVSVLNSDFRQTFRKVSNAKMFDLITNLSLLILGVANNNVTSLSSTHCSAWYMKESEKIMHYLTCCISIDTKTCILIYMFRQLWKIKIGNLQYVWLLTLTYLVVYFVSFPSPKQMPTQKW